MEVLKTLADCAGDLCQIGTFAALLCRPVREWLFDFEAIREGQRCLLRSEIVRIYYKHNSEKRLREYEYKNILQCYKAYKALKGNSFIDHLFGEMEEWDII